MARRASESDYERVQLGHHQVDEDLAVIVAESGRRAAALLPRSVSQLTAEQVECVSDVQHLALLIADHQDQLARLVAEARDLGVSWAAIGWSVGTSGEAARQRWGASPADSVPPPATARKRPGKKAAGSRGQSRSRRK